MRREDEDAQAAPFNRPWSEPAEYRKRWNLAADYPMVAPDYAAKRKELAVKIGLGRKPKVVVEVAPRRRRGGRRRRTLRKGTSGRYSEPPAWRNLGLCCGS
jgi:hypothetical protein